MKGLTIKSLNIGHLWRLVKKVKCFQKRMCRLSDAQLQAKTSEFKVRLKQGESLDDLLPEAFAVVCEADYRRLNLLPFDVQIMGAIVLYQGNLAEMKTGEGKTLTATMPLYLHALTGQSTLLVTSNEYLANRDATKMGQVYRWLGLTCACSSPVDPKTQLSANQKRHDYAAEIVYTTSSTLGFDYLIDNLASQRSNQFMRPFSYAIVDEADQVLLDNAQTPLIISGAPRVQSNMYGLSDQFIATLDSQKDYRLDHEQKAVWLTADGTQAANRYFRIHNLFDGQHTELVRHLALALRAHHLFKNGKDYVVQGNQVQLLDQQNGRVMPMTKLESGQHQALEAAEQVPITPNLRAMAAITYQNLFRMFPKLAGMSGTGKSAEEELIDVYAMKVVQIPTNRPLIRRDLPDRIYTSVPEKLLASLGVVKKIHQSGRPLLIVTGSVSLSELYSELLLQAGIAHNVLNARNVAKEAQMIAEAGQKNAVTIATEMAGRGTDIKLGPEVACLGGLAVIGIEKPRNPRAEWQLRGRAGRQGLPGSSQFFISLEDDVVKKFGPRGLQHRVQKQQNFTSPKLLHSLRIKHAVQRAQQVSDSTGEQQRKVTLAFDESVRIQREKVYRQRQQLIDQQDLKRLTLQVIHAFISSFVADLSQVDTGVVLQFVLENLSYHFDRKTFLKKIMSKMVLQKRLEQLAETELTRKTENLSSFERDHFYRCCLLKAIDSVWIEEVDGLQQLRTMVISRQYAQKNPIYEYHQGAARSFKKMQRICVKQSVQNLLLSTVESTSTGKLMVYFL